LSIAYVSDNFRRVITSTLEETIHHGTLRLHRSCCRGLLGRRKAFTGVLFPRKIVVVRLGIGPVWTVVSVGDEITCFLNFLVRLFILVLYAIRSIGGAIFTGQEAG
jgi:hypothetical protein